MDPQIKRNFQQTLQLFKKQLAENTKTAVEDLGRFSSVAWHPAEEYFLFEAFPEAFSVRLFIGDHHLRPLADFNVFKNLPEGAFPDRNRSLHMKELNLDLRSVREELRSIEENQYKIFTDWFLDCLRESQFNPDQQLFFTIHDTDKVLNIGTGQWEPVMSHIPKRNFQKNEGLARINSISTPLLLGSILVFVLSGWLTWMTRATSLLFFFLVPTLAMIGSISALLWLKFKTSKSIPAYKIMEVREFHKKQGLY